MYPIEIHHSCRWKYTVGRPMDPMLVGSFNLFEKYDRQTGNLPQVEVKIWKCLQPPTSYGWLDGSSIITGTSVSPAPSVFRQPGRDRPPFHWPAPVAEQGHRGRPWRGGAQNPPGWNTWTWIACFQCLEKVLKNGRKKKIYIYIYTYYPNTVVFSGVI